MDKSKIKTKYDYLRGKIIMDLIRETGLSPSFIRSAIRKERSSERAEQIRKEYLKRYEKIQNALKND